jgi:hypothetical protein
LQIACILFAARYIVTRAAGFAACGWTKAMRAEIEKLVEEIKQSIGLLRRHL